MFLLITRFSLLLTYGYKIIRLYQHHHHSLLLTTVMLKCIWGLSVCSSELSCLNSFTDFIYLGEGQFGQLLGSGKKKLGNMGYSSAIKVLNNCLVSPVLLPQTEQTKYAMSFVPATSKIPLGQSLFRNVFSSIAI